MNKVEEAVAKIKEARRLLDEAGMKEQLFPLTVDIVSQESVRSFAKFGDDNGIFCTIGNSDAPNEVTITFGVVRRSGIKRFWLAIREFFVELFCRRTEYKINIKDADIVELKNMLRIL